MKSNLCKSLERKTETPLIISSLEANFPNYKEDIIL